MAGAIQTGNQSGGRSLKRWVLVICGAGVIIVAATAVAISTLNSTDWRKYEKPLAEAVFEATGRRLSFDGEFLVKIGLSPSVTIKDLTLESAQWGSSEDMLTIGYLVLRIRLLPLIFGNIKVRHAELTGLKLLLETNSEGVGNWQFDNLASDDEPTSEDSSPPAWAAFVQLAIIKDASVKYQDGVSGDTHLFHIDELRATSENDIAPLHLQLRARYEEEHIEFSGHLTGLSTILMGDPLGLQAELKALGATLAVEGEIAEPLQGMGIDLRGSLAGDSLNRLAKFSGYPLSGFGPFTLALNLAGNPKEFTISNLTLNVDEISIAGEVSASISGERPHINANLTLPALSLMELQTRLNPEVAPAAGTAAKNTFARNDDRLFPYDSLPFAELEAFDAIDVQLHLQVGEFRASEELTLSNIDVELNAMTSEPTVINLLNLDVMGGSIDGTVNLNIASGAPRVAVVLHIAHLDMGAVAESRDSDVITKGPLELNVDVSGAGLSVREIMASLNGEIVMEIGVATIHDEWAGRMSAGLGAALTNKANRETKLNCIIAQFDVDDGIATASDLVIDMPRLALIGAGTINLRSEIIELDFDRDATGASALGALPPFRVRGTLNEPTGRANLGALFKKTVGLGASVVTGRVRKGSRVTAQSGPERCHQVLALFRQKKKNEEEAKKATAELVKKTGTVTKNVAKTTFGKLRNFFRGNGD